jgi:hypothetical protein
MATIGCLIVATVTLAFASSCGVGSFMFDDFETFESKFKWETIVALTARAVTDTTVALTLCVTLSQNRTGMARWVLQHLHLHPLTGSQAQITS